MLSTHLPFQKFRVPMFCHSRKPRSDFHFRFHLPVGLATMRFCIRDTQRHHMKDINYVTCLFYGRGSPLSIHDLVALRFKLNPNVPLKTQAFSSIQDQSPSYAVLFASNFNVLHSKLRDDMFISPNQSFTLTSLSHILKYLFKIKCLDRHSLLYLKY